MGYICTYSLIPENVFYEESIYFNLFNLSRDSYKGRAEAKLKEERDSTRNSNEKQNPSNRNRNRNRNRN
jgi:hypothetical protein